MDAPHTRTPQRATAGDSVANNAAVSMAVSRPTPTSLSRRRGFRSPYTLPSSGLCYGLSDSGTAGPPSAVRDAPSPVQDVPPANKDAVPDDTLALSAQPCSSAVSAASSPTRKRRKQVSPSPPPKRLKGKQTPQLDAESIFSAFQSISETLTSIASHIVPRAAPSTAPDPDPTDSAPGPLAMTHPSTAPSSTAARPPCSEPPILRPAYEDSGSPVPPGPSRYLDLHPISDPYFSRDPRHFPDPRYTSDHHDDPAPPQSSTRADASNAGHHLGSQADSSEDEFISSAAGLSQSETHLRLLQRDMIHVLGLPSSEPQPPRTSFKRHSTRQDSSTPVFPELPVDSLCTDIFKHISESKRWRPFRQRASAYFQFSPDVLPSLFSTPEIPVAVRDKLSADSGRSFSTKLPYADKDKNLLESTLAKLDKAARFGLRCSSFLALLTEYIAFACEEDSPVSPDMATIALQALDENISSVFEQFSRIVSLATSVRRSTAIDAMNIPYEGVKSKLQNLPLSGTDLFADKFLDTMESEVKRIETTSKLSLREPAPRQLRPPYRASRPRQTSRRQEPPLRSFRPPLRQPAQGRSSSSSRPVRPSQRGQKTRPSSSRLPPRAFGGRRR